MTTDLPAMVESALAEVVAILELPSGCSLYLKRIERGFPVPLIDQQGNSAGYQLAEFTVYLMDDIPGPKETSLVSVQI